jgi:uncharacterized protein YcnI
MTKGWMLAAALTAGVNVAQAHVVLEQPRAPAGTFYKATFVISHGCKGSPTTRVTVRIPEGVRAARPQPRAGWSLTIRGAVARDIVEAVWDRDAPQNAHHDEFVVLMQLPDTAGILYFQVRQDCEQGRIDWVDIPGPGRSTRGSSPAPALEVTPAASEQLPPR